MALGNSEKEPGLKPPLGLVPVRHPGDKLLSDCSTAPSLLQGSGALPAESRS